MTFDPSLTLDPYQVEGAHFLAGRRRAILADGMGLGKTPQAIRASDLAGAHSVLVLCPAIGRAMWEREFRRWGRLPRAVEIYSYTKYARDKALRKATEARAKAGLIDTLILDEAHYLKTRDSDRTKAIYGRLVDGGLAAAMPHVWLLSGTIVPNHALELWTHMHALWPNLIAFNPTRPMKFDEFAVRYCRMKPNTVGFSVMENKKETIGELREALRRVALRRTFIPDLPPLLGPFDHVVEAETVSADLKMLEQDIDPDARALIVEMAEAGISISDTVPIATLRRITGIAKAHTVAQLVAEELRAGEYDKIILFAYHSDVLAILAERLFDHGVVIIDGKTSEKKRLEAERRFQQDMNVRVMLGQIIAASTTITLHAAAEVGLVEMSWSPHDNAQAIKRAHRYGQKKTVRARAFTLAGSIDEDVGRVLARKTRMTLEILGEQ